MYFLATAMTLRFGGSFLSGKKYKEEYETLEYDNRSTRDLQDAGVAIQRIDRNPS